MPKLLVLLFILLLPSMTTAAPESKLIKFWQASDESSSATLDHSVWQSFLNDYLIADDPYDISLMDYESVSHEDRIALKLYIDDLVSLDPRRYSFAVQKAYWINLYNALTVDLVLDNYPLQSITELGNKFFSFGPWNDTIISVAGEKLSLNDIEHGILRPLYKDPRIHYAVNCASVSCPNLSAQAFTGGNTENLLEQAARGYINHPRALSIDGNTLNLSSIYDWYRIDFGTTQQFREHLINYADMSLAAQLRAGGLKHIQYSYDWSLNSI